MNNKFNFDSWIKECFNTKELEQYKKLRESFSPKFWEDYHTKWRNLVKKVEANLKLDPHSIEAKNLYDEWMALVDLAYKDYPGLKEKMWQNFKLGVATQMDYMKQSVIDFIDKVSQFYK